MCSGCVQSGMAAADSLGLDPLASKFIAIGATAIMLFGAMTPLANPTTQVKAGAVCVKANQKVVKSGKTFVCKKSGKKLVWKVQKKKIIKPSTSPIDSPKTNPPTRQPFVEKGEYVNLDFCQLKDARIKKIQPNNVGFPLQQDIIQVSGSADIIVIPVDFSDLPAKEDPTIYLQEQTKAMADWYNFFSNGKFKLTFQIGAGWVSPERPNSDYAVRKDVAGGSGVDTDVQTRMAQDIINASKDQFDFSRSNSIFFYMPTNKAVDFDMGARGTWLTTKYGTKGFFFWGGGAYHFDSRNLSSEIKKKKMWAFWIHEMLHSQGLALHAPGNGFETSLSSNQYGKSLVLNAWELFRLNWLTDPNIVCIEGSNLTSNNLTLKPLELGSNEMKVVIIKLNQYEALVVESRRPIGYSSEWDKTDSGLLVYHVDVRRDNDRFNESTGKDWGNDPEYSKWGFYLVPDGKSIVGRGGLTYSQYIIKPEESVTYGGIRIRLINSYEYDDVEITKVS